MGGSTALRRSTRISVKSHVDKPEVSTIVRSKYFSDKSSAPATAKRIKKEEEGADLFDKEDDDGATDMDFGDSSVFTNKKRKLIHEPPIGDAPHPVSGSKMPPKNFYKIYNEVKSMRSKIITPVDTMGCAFLPERISGINDGPVFRYQLLISLMLSSQTKDEVNAQVMQILQTTMKAKGFEDGLCVDSIMSTSEQELDTLIYKVGFHTRKAKYIKQTTEIIKAQYNSDIPKTIEEITAFPGVGPKMGYLLLQSAWDITIGLGVDVHIFRLANMWGWVPKVKNPTPESTRLELEKWLPRELWKEFNPVIVGFGQSVCQPRGRRCDLCTLPKYGRLCPNVDRALLKKIGTQGDGINQKSPRKIRGDLSGIMKIKDIEDLA